MNQELNEELNASVSVLSDKTRSHACVPTPWGLPSTHSPRYVSPDAGQHMTPRPFFWSHAHPPSYQLPEAYCILPLPCLRS